MPEGLERNRHEAKSSARSMTTRQGQKENNQCNSKSTSRVTEDSGGVSRCAVMKRVPAVTVGAMSQRTLPLPTGGCPIVSALPQGSPTRTSFALPLRASSSEGTHGHMRSMSQETRQFQRVAVDATGNSAPPFIEDPPGASSLRDKSTRSHLVTRSHERSDPLQRPLATASTSFTRDRAAIISQDLHIEKSGRRSSVGSGSYIDIHVKAQRVPGERNKVEGPIAEFSKVTLRYSQVKGHSEGGQGRKNTAQFMSDSDGEGLEESEDETMHANDAIDNALEQEQGTATFYNEDGEVQISPGILEDGGGPSGEEDDYENVSDKADEEDDEYPSESAKRKQRRHEMNARLREGDRRHAEGLPRNFLMVDKYTKEPYKQGVGSWRKELMMLSKSLDPAIGNINRQPYDAVKEVVDWIQHTWEYERPMRWEIVKEVIARGVNLRCSNLWKLIRMEKAKSDGVSDRSWRSLSAQMKSPAMIQKSQNCSKANASRNNFGRTGPSSQVGVRERLQKKLKRSPSPDKIRMEMARPKGYSGVSKREDKVQYIMHGNGEENFNDRRRGGNTSGSEGKGNFPAGRMCAGLGDTEDGYNEDVGGGSRALVSTIVLSLSEDEVVQHPSFIRILQRLEALENRGNSAVMQCDAVESLYIPVEQTVGTFEKFQMEEQAMRKSGQSDSASGIQRSSRLNNKENDKEEVATQ